MKKLFTLAALVLVTSAFAQSSWRMGVTAGAFGSHSRLSGGMQNASALFTPQAYGSPMLGLVFRKTINNHLSFQTGFNFSSIGFQYAMAQNYNLTKPHTHYMINRVGMGTTTIPATLIWNFNPNCKNVRWFVGGGLSVMGHGAVKHEKTNYATEGDIQTMGLSNGDYLSQTVTTNNNLALNGHIMFGVEKLLKRGTMLSLACYLNRGFTPVAISTVNYSVNNTVYTHTFKNKNDFCGLTLTYYFKNFKGSNIKPAPTK